MQEDVGLVTQETAFFPVSRKASRGLSLTKDAVFVVRFKTQLVVFKQPIQHFLRIGLLAHIPAWLAP